MAESKLIAWGWANRGTYLTHLVQRYGINGELFDSFWEKQDGKCAGCLEAFAHPYRKLALLGIRPEVDHNHADGKVRGLLCRRCNDFLGKVKDNHEILHRLMEYLKANGEVL